MLYGPIVLVQIVAAIVIAGIADAQPTPAAQRQAVASTRVFRLYSDPMFNLHDFLNWRTSGLDAAPRDSCTAPIEAADRAAFAAAEQHYAAKRGTERSRFIIAMRFELAGHPGLGLVADSITARGHEVLRAALPAYHACWWRAHDARNRAWIADVVPRLRAHEDSIRARLGRVYQAEWEGPFPVDVVSFASSTGANTVIDPDHVAISAADSSYRGDAAVEMLFHEISHTVVDTGRDIIRRLLSDTAVVGAPPLPRELSHVLLFYSTGYVTRQRLAQVGRPYRMYMDEELWNRAWPRYRAPVERWWTEYMEGRTEAAEAIRQIVRALREGGGNGGTSTFRQGTKHRNRDSGTPTPAARVLPQFDSVTRDVLARADLIATTSGATV